MSNLKVGQIVPLLATLECHNGETVYVRATIKDETNVVLSQSALIDRGNGEFSLSTYLMPDKPIINVRYEVFDNPGFTTPNDTFCPDDESYARLEVDKAQAIATDHLVGVIKNEKLFGIIKNQNIKLLGIISKVKLIGSIKSVPSLIGVVSDVKLSGIIRE